MSGRNVSVRECHAIRLLARDGWTKGELKMCFHLSRTQMVAYHATGECTHSHAVPPVVSVNHDNDERPPTNRDSP